MLLDYRGNPIYSDFGLFKINYKVANLQTKSFDTKQAIVTHDMLMTFLESDCPGDVYLIEYLGLSDPYLKGEKQFD